MTERERPDTQHRQHRKHEGADSGERILPGVKKRSRRIVRLIHAPVHTQVMHARMTCMSAGARTGKEGRGGGGMDED